MTDNIKHIAIIMDGNGRWATSKGLPRSAGHKKGAETLMEILKTAADLKIPYMTLYAFSTENWQRDKSEVDYLMGLLRQYLNSDLKEIEDRGARIVFIGERNMLAQDIMVKMSEIERRTKNNKNFTLCIALSYGSRAEIVAAAKKAAKLVADGELKPNDLDEKTFSNLLYTSGIPDPDLVIRTSGEQRISNYLLWQIAYSELYFTKTLWPDFSTEEFKAIISDFNLRERRYGKV